MTNESTNVPDRLTSLAMRGTGRYEETALAGRGDVAIIRQPAGRSWAPENLLGDACVNPASPQCDRSRLIHSFVSTAGEPFVMMQTADYSTLGPLGQARAALRTLYSVGTQNVARYVGVVVGADLVATIPNIGPLPGGSGACIGFRFDWGISYLSYQPFDLEIVSDGFFNLHGGQSLDRHFTLRVNALNGCSIFAPFAQRVSPSMSVAQVQVAEAALEVGNATIRARNVPPTLLANMSVTVQLLTAFGPATAAWAEIESVVSDSN